MEREIYSKSGIPVYSYTNSAAHSFFIALYLRAGSMYESDAEAGITHLFEHIAIRNINHRMAGELYRVLDRYGLEFNASTYNEMVQFYIAGPTKSIRVAADIIAAVLAPVTLPRSEVDKERARVRAEVREVGESTSLSTFASLAVWEGTPLKRSIMGTLGSISKIGVRALEDYRRRTLTADNLFAYVTGAVGDEDIAYLAAALDGYELGRGEAHDNIAPSPAGFLNRAAVLHIKNADFTGVKFTFDLTMSEVTMPELDLLYDVLFGGYSSDFFIELSENRGLFYDLGGAIERYSNIGTLSFTYELREAHLYKALALTVDILRRYKTDLIAPDRMMKAGYTDGAMMLYDDARELNFTFAYDNHIMKQGYPDLAARAAAYAAVTPERLREVARTVFTPSRLTLALKGNKRRIDTEKIAEIIKGL